MYLSQRVLKLPEYTSSQIATDFYRPFMAIKICFALMNIYSHYPIVVTMKNNISSICNQKA